jgi:hypothetical protein
MSVDPPVEIRIRITATIESTDADTVVGILSTWLAADWKPLLAGTGLEGQRRRLNLRHRMFGWQIEYEGTAVKLENDRNEGREENREKDKEATGGEEMTLSCYEATGMPYSLLEGGLVGVSLEVAARRLKKLKRVCMDEGVGSQIEYALEDVDGCDLSEEFSVPTDEE